MFDKLKTAAAIVAQHMPAAADNDKLVAMTAAKDTLLEYVRQFHAAFGGKDGGIPELVCVAMVGAAMAFQWRHDEEFRQIELDRASKGAPNPSVARWRLLRARRCPT